MKRPFWKSALGVVAALFGALTLVSGGSVLFSGEVRAAAGNVVNFVLWFNFLSGALYIVAGIGIWMQKPWAPALAVLLAVLVSLVFVLFGWHVVSGGAYEPRTVGAMILRAGFWIAAAIALWRSSRKPG